LKLTGIEVFSTLEIRKFHKSAHFSEEILWVGKLQKVTSVHAKATGVGLDSTA
jgi:hypothetical protein